MMFTRRSLLATTAGAVAGIAAPVLARASAATQSQGGSAFGSYWRLTLPDGADPAPATRAIVEIVARTDRLMSPYRADSEISRFNRAPAGVLPAARETLAVVRAAMEAAHDTSGEFDPTLGPLVARWGFGPIRDGVAGRLDQIGVEDRVLVKSDPEATLDLCGIAKGFALDRMRDALLALDRHDFLLELGGEVAAQGLHPSGRAWRVGLDGTRLALSLGDESVATSGALAQNYSLGRTTYSHIIDPATRTPADGGLLSVSVFGPSGTGADALATALFAMGQIRGPDFARRRGLDALFLSAGRDGHAMDTTGAAGHRILGGQA